MYRPHGAPAATRLLRPVSHWPLFESGQQRIATRGSPGRISSSIRCFAPMSRSGTERA